MSRDGVVAGMLVSVGVTQFMVMMIVCEALYPGYSVAHNYISDLGVGATSSIFNTSIILLGVMVVAAVFFVHRVARDRFFLASMLLAGIGAVGVGVFPEGSPYGLHFVMSAVTFIFAGISAIASYRSSPRHLGVLSIVLGVSSLTALTLFALELYLGIGKGGMERMIAYPVLSWALIYAGHLMTR